MKHLIKLALVLLAGTAAYFVFEFVAQVAAFGVALFASGSLVATYVGLAFAPIPQAQRRRATLVAQVAMGIEAAYGFLYVLSLQSPDVFARPLNIWLSVPLALLHGGAFSVLAYFVSLFVVHGQDEAAQSGALTIAEQRDLVIVDALEKLTARLEAPAAPQLTDNGAEMIDLNGQRISLRQIADATGTPLTTLRRKLAQPDRGEPV